MLHNCTYMYMLGSTPAEHSTLVISQNGRTPLYLACEKNYIQIAQLLLDRGATVNLGSNVRYYFGRHSEQLSNSVCNLKLWLVADHIRQYCVLHVCNQACQPSL